MRVKRRFSTRWGHPYHRQGACTECRQTLLHPLCSITPMTPEGYTEYSAQSKREDTSDTSFESREASFSFSGAPAWGDGSSFTSMSSLSTSMASKARLCSCYLQPVGPHALPATIFKCPRMVCWRPLRTRLLGSEQANACLSRLTQKTFNQYRYPALLATRGSNGCNRCSAIL